MKQMNDVNDDVEENIFSKRLLPIAAFVFSLLLSSGVIAETITNDENDSIVTAMYGFVNSDYADYSSYTDDDYVEDLVQSIYGKAQGPDYSKESVYVDSLVRSVNGTSQPNAPDYSNDEVYANHLVEIILK